MSSKQNNCLTSFSKLWPNNYNLLPNCGNTVMKLNCGAVSSQKAIATTFPQHQPQQTSRRLHQQEKHQSSLQNINGWLAQQEHFENITNITFGVSNNPVIWAPKPVKKNTTRDGSSTTLLPQLTSLSQLRSKKAVREWLKIVFFFGIIPKPVTSPPRHIFCHSFGLPDLSQSCLIVAWKLSQSCLKIVSNFPQRCL